MSHAPWSVRWAHWVRCKKAFRRADSPGSKKLLDVVHIGATIRIRLNDPYAVCACLLDYTLTGLNEQSIRMYIAYKW